MKPHRSWCATADGFDCNCRGVPPARPDNRELIRRLEVLRSYHDAKYNKNKKMVHSAAYEVLSAAIRALQS